MKLKQLQDSSPTLTRIYDIADKLYFKIGKSNFRSDNPHEVFNVPLSDVVGVVKDLTNRFGKPAVSPRSKFWEWTFKFHNRRFHVLVLKGNPGEVQVMAFPFTKKSPLDEAAYSGEHPLIARIKDGIDKQEKTTIEVTIPLSDARDLISKEYGRPKKYPRNELFGSLVQYVWQLGEYLTVTLTDQKDHAVVHVYNFRMNVHY